MHQPETLENPQVSKFQPGNGGRPRGARNCLTGDFIGALAADFAENGIDVIRVVRVEEPATYLKIIASTLPRELDITATTQLQELSDDDLPLPDLSTTHYDSSTAQTPSLSNAVLLESLKAGGSGDSK